MDGQNDIKVRHWIDKLQMYGKHAFSKEMIERDLNGYSPVGLKRALSRLSTNGKIVSIYKGYYLIIPVQYTSRRILPPDIFLDTFMRFLQRSYYLSLLNAAAWHGAAHQQPQEFYVVTNLPALLPIHKKNLKINFIGKKNIPSNLVKIIKTESGYMNISNPILTATDLIQFEKRIGGMNRVATVLNELADQIITEDFNQSLLECTPVTTLQRLGFIFERVIGRDILAASLYEVLQKGGIKLYPIPLKASEGKTSFQIDARWKIIINKQIEIDE